jgi:hypothetical protein
MALATFSTWQGSIVELIGLGVNSHPKYKTRRIQGEKTRSAPPCQIRPIKKPSKEGFFCIEDRAHWAF